MARIKEMHLNAITSTPREFMLALGTLKHLSRQLMDLVSSNTSIHFRIRISEDQEMMPLGTASVLKDKDSEVLEMLETMDRPRIYTSFLRQAVKRALSVKKMM